MPIFKNAPQDRYYAELVFRTNSIGGDFKEKRVLINSVEEIFKYSEALSEKYLLDRLVFFDKDHKDAELQFSFTSINKAVE